MTTFRISAACAASALLLAGGLVMAGCGSSSSTTIPTEADGAAYAEVNSANGDGESTVGVAVGGKFVVGFTCSPGTGYRWKTATPSDSVLVLKDEGTCKPDDASAAEDGMVGWSGHQYRTYEVRSAGTQVLTFQWVGPGRGATPEATQVVTVSAS